MTQKLQKFKGASFLQSGQILKIALNVASALKAILKPEKAIIAPKVWQVIAFAQAKEESPSCNKTEFHLTDGWGDPRDSVTESKLPLRR